jgi:hypothetical protein
MTAMKNVKRVKKILLYTYFFVQSIVIHCNFDSTNYNTMEKIRKDKKLTKKS